MECPRSDSSEKGVKLEDYAIILGSSFGDKPSVKK